MKPRGPIGQLAASPDGDLAIVRQDMLTVDIHDMAPQQDPTGFTPHVRPGVPGEVGFARDGRIIATRGLHAITRKNPSFLSLHALPPTRTATLEAVRAPRDAEAPRGLDGTRRVAEPVGQR